MSNFHCLAIQFPNVDFSKYFLKREVEINKVY
jgi:hypothetical protein